MRYQSVNDLTQRIGSSWSTAPEVNNAIKEGPKEIGCTSLWDVLKYSDVYAVGALCFRALNLEVPSSNGAVFYDSDIPNLPSEHYSFLCNTFFRRLIAFRPKDRPSTKDAISTLEALLWGPSMNTSAPSNLHQWLLERKLDLVFNVSGN